MTGAGRGWAGGERADADGRTEAEEMTTLGLARSGRRCSNYGHRFGAMRGHRTDESHSTSDVEWNGVDGILISITYLLSRSLGSTGFLGSP